MQHLKKHFYKKLLYNFLNVNNSILKNNVVKSKQINK